MGDSGSVCDVCDAHLATGGEATQQSDMLRGAFQGVTFWKWAPRGLSGKFICLDMLRYGVPWVLLRRFSTNGRFCIPVLINWCVGSWCCDWAFSNCRTVMGWCHIKNSWGALVQSLRPSQGRSWRVASSSPFSPFMCTSAGFANSCFFLVILNISQSPWFSVASIQPIPYMIVFLLRGPYQHEGILQGPGALERWVC